MNQSRSSNGFNFNLYVFQESRFSMLESANVDNPCCWGHIQRIIIDRFHNRSHSMEKSDKKLDDQFKQKINELSASAKLDHTVSILSSIVGMVKDVRIDQIEHPSAFLFEFVKPAVRAAIAIKVSAQPETKTTVQQIVTMARNYYVESVNKCYCLDGFELLRELLQSDNQVYRYENPELSEQQREQEIQKLKWVLDQTSFRQPPHNLFFSASCEYIIEQLEDLPSNLACTGINFVREFINFIYFMESFIKRDKIVNMTEDCIVHIEQILMNPIEHKQFCKDLEFHNCEQLTNSFHKLLRSIEAKKRAELLGSLYGTSLLNNPSIEKKMAGLKILNKWAGHFMIGTNYIREQEYCKWLVDNKIIEYVLEDGANVIIIKTCRDILRVYLRRKCTSEARFHQFFEFAQKKACSEVRQLLFKYLDMDSIKFSYCEYQFVYAKFKDIQRAEFYEEQMFSLILEYLRFSVEDQCRKVVDIFGEILKTHWGKFNSQRVEHKCMTCVYKAVNRWVDKKFDEDQKMQILFGLYDRYLSQPTLMGILVMKNVIDGLQEISFSSKPRVCYKFLFERTILQDGIKLIIEGVPYKRDMEEFICYLLKYAKDVVFDRARFSKQVYLEATQCPSIFQNMLPFLSDDDYMQQLFETLVSAFNLNGFPFSCIRTFFYRLNSKVLKPINEQYAIEQYESMVTASEMQGYDILEYLLYSCKIGDGRIRNELANFISDLYTMHDDNITQKSEASLILLMKKLADRLLHPLELHSQDEQCKLLGVLALIEYSMMVTETLGVGELKPHNSLVATATARLKVFNEVTDGNDVLKVFEKSLPSNMLVFELLEQLGKQFKCSPHEIIFREGNTVWSDKYNGLTLEEMEMNGKVLSAIKSFRERIRKEELLVGEELSPKARAAFQEIYNTFAVDGKMGRKECARYVEGVTRLTCTVYDSRVDDMFRDFDSDKDDALTLDDFLRFYKFHSTEKRCEAVWKNLAYMRFQRNLKKYNDPLEPPNKELMMRYYLSSHEQIYRALFTLAENDNSEIRSRATRLLFRLPTCPSTLQDLSSDLQLIEKNSFQIEYLLIAIKKQLNSGANREERIHKFIKSGNAEQIFQMMKRIDDLGSPTPDETKCLSISLQILRSLNQVSNLREIIDENYCVGSLVDLPETTLFHQLATKALLNVDPAIFQASLALQMTQTQNGMQIALSAVFDEEVELRKIACNYILLCDRLGKVKQDLFKIKVKKNNSQWFSLLSKIVRTKKSLDFKDILHHCLGELSCKSQNIERNPQDQQIFGNLCLIKNIIEYSTVELPHDFLKQITVLATKVISVRNRNMIYKIMSSQNWEYTIEYIQSLLGGVQYIKGLSSKNNYVGIKNLGSTCYMNSILQMLFQIEEFKKLIFELQPDSQLAKTEVEGVLMYDDVLYQLQKMYTFLELSTREYYDSKEFCLAIKDSATGKSIDPRIQQDAHEFTSRFLDGLEVYMKDSDKLEALKRIFQGKTLTEFTCKECLNKITRQEDFIELSLEVKQIESLHKSFEKFITPEEITDYYCEICQKKVDKIQKSIFLSELPSILIVNLQRIIFDLETFENCKVNTAFKFPEYLNVEDYVSKETCIRPEQCSYSLKGVVVHSGTSESGHYYSIIKNKDGWFKFNDKTVTKFDIKDLSREAFGGVETQDQWNDQLKFSTNAYILFYEKKQVDGKQPNQSESQSCNETRNQFCSQIDQDNRLFFSQIQVHQQSMFDFAISQYELYQPPDIEKLCTLKSFEENWSESPRRGVYEKIYALMMKLLDFLHTFYEVRMEIIVKLGSYLYQLYFLLPEKSYEFIMEMDVEVALERLCMHNSEGMRNIYCCILNKAMHVFFMYYGLDLSSVENGQSMEQEEGVSKFKIILDAFLSFMTDERLLKNIHKCFKFFQFWRHNCRLIAPIRQYANEREMIVKVIDLLMGNDSPLAQQAKKRSEIPAHQALSALQLLIYLLKGKKNLNGYIDPDHMVSGTSSQELTPMEREMVGNVKFYANMIKNKADDGLLAEVTAKLADHDIEFSQKIVELFLKCLNCSYDQIESSLIIIHHLKQYLSIDDDYSLDRLKWVFGIPQLEMDEMNFGVQYSDESGVYSYVSPLFFIGNDQYQPALQVLYFKRTIYNSFSVAGVVLLLEMLVESDLIFHYVMNLPAPSYIHRSYIDWIQEFINRLKSEEGYYCQVDQKRAYATLSQAFSAFQLKLKQYHMDLPVNKLIIGKNKSIEFKGSLQCPQYQLALWAHTTYVIENKPTGIVNQSLPKQLFKFASPTGYAQYFVCSHKRDDLPESELLDSRLTMLSLHLDAKQSIKINFKFKNFTEKITFAKGKIQVNFPYEELSAVSVELTEQEMNTYLEIAVISLEQKQQNLAKSELYHTEEPMIAEANDIYAEKECRTCTYINFLGNTCEVCGNPLI